MEVIGKIRLGKKTVLFEDCSDMILDNYIKIVETNDLKYLVKSGALPKKNVLEKKMEEINKEFSGLRGENNMIKMFDLICFSCFRCFNDLFTQLFK